jgi:hypothetical protein
MEKPKPKNEQEEGEIETVVKQLDLLSKKGKRWPLSPPLIKPGGRDKGDSL